MHRLMLAVVLLILGTGSGLASNCQAIATAPSGQSSLLQLASAEPRSAPAVAISYVGHSTFRIVAPDGTIIATDYAGYAGDGPIPDIVTMNHAHSSHFTMFPDPAIAHALPGWGMAGIGIQHYLDVGEVLIRNVTTDIRSYGMVEENGNSIFVFEMAGLCIGHLGHLHQPLSDGQVAEIGRLDVVFVPIDGSYTMDQAAMMEVVTRLRASIVIPMHWFSSYTLADFVDRTRAGGVAVEWRGEPDLTVSLDTLPAVPRLIVLSTPGSL